MNYAEAKAKRQAAVARKALVDKLRAEVLLQMETVSALLRSKGCLVGPIEVGIEYVDIDGEPCCCAIPCRHKNTH